MEETRTKNSVYNILSNVLVYFEKYVLTFIVRTIFIKILGATYLGVNGLLSNVLSMLSLAELGIGTAISFNLYKPLAQNDSKTISSLMTFYKKAYNIIGVIVASVGMMVFACLNFIIKDADSIPHLKIIYILFLINTVSTYYTSYKEILIIADQKYYKLTKINVVYTLLLNIFQIIVLILFRNFIVYLIVQFFIQILQKISINKKIGKLYENIDFKSEDKVSDNIIAELKKNVKAMVVHKVGDYCINGTDNIIISSFINVIEVGIYSNYTMIVNAINSIITTIYNSITASFGNLLVENNGTKEENIFRKLEFIEYLLYSTFSVIFISSLNLIIEIWIGKEYVFSENIVWLISFNFFLTGTRMAITIVRNSAGEYDKDKYIPIIQSIVNILVSIWGAKKFGIFGVILGTVISSILPCIYRPYIVYKYVFKKDFKKYLINTYLKYVSIFIATSILIVKLRINVPNIYVRLIANVCIAIILQIAINIVIFKKTEEYDYCIKILKNTCMKFIRKVQKHEEFKS